MNLETPLEIKEKIIAIANYYEFSDICFDQEYPWPGRNSPLA